MNSTIKRSLMAAMMIGAGFTLAACDIEQTREASLPDVNVDAESGQMPEYEVVKTQEGELPDVDISAEGGKLPAYDVDMAEMEVETKTIEVEVPSDVDIVMPDEDQDAKTQ